MNVKRILAYSLLSFTFCASMAIGMKASAATAKPFSAYYEASIVGIDLNGNSAVIRESANGSDYFNIYYDENRNGKVDDTEEAVAMSLDARGETIDIASTVRIYGLQMYDESSEPVLITMESGTVDSIYGTCLGTINTTSDNALAIHVKGGTIENGLWGAYLSDVSTEAGKTAIDIDVSGDAIVKGYFKAVEGMSSGNTITGNVDIDWNTTNLSSAENGVSTFYGITNKVEVIGDVDVYINKLYASSIYGLNYDVKVNGDYTYKSELGTNVTGAHYGMYNSTVDGNVDIALSGAQTDNSVPYVSGIQGSCSGAGDTVVNGTCKVTYSGGYADNMYGIYSSSDTINGDVIVDVKGGQAVNMWLLEGVTILGSLTADVRPNSEAVEDIIAFKQGSVRDDVTMNLYNAYTGENTGTGSCRALRNVNVGGDVHVLIDGGYYDHIEGVGAEFGTTGSFGGNVDLQVRNIGCANTMMIYHSTIAKDVKLSLENCEIVYGSGLYGVTLGGKASVDVDGTTFGSSNNSNYTYMFYNCKNTGVAKIDITGTTCVGQGCFSPYDTSTGTNGDVYVSMKNMEFKDSTFVEYRTATNQNLYFTVDVDTKVGETTTVEDSLCDLSGFATALMHPEEYTFGEVNGLPEGLEFNEGKVYGTPTVAYVDGKDVTISMTDTYTYEEEFTVRFVVADKDCAFDTKWSSDDKQHWHACTDEGCDKVKDKAEHTWDAGAVTKEATTTEKGVKTYTCAVCKATKTDEIPVVTDNDENTQGGGTEGENEVAIPSTKGTVLKDNDKKGDYIVTNADATSPEVSYKVTSKTAKEIVVPKTITVDGVTYKVTSVQKNAFKNHKNLKKVIIGANVKTIGKNAFYGCKKLTTVTMGKNVKTIGASAFYNCTALKKITLPKSVTKIGAKAFYNCKKLTKITINTTKLTKKNVGKKAFTKAGSNNYKKLTVKVPKNKKKAYKTMLKQRGLSSKAKVK